MNEINQKIHKAQRRLLVARFFSISKWALFASLLVAALAMTIPKIWHLEFLSQPGVRNLWLAGWTGGSLTIGLLTAVVLTWIRRPSSLSTAVEVDQRFGLKARLSSALSLSPEDAQSSAGQSLLHDAQRRAEGIDIGEKFPFQFRWSALLPLAPLVLMGALILIPDAQKQVVAAEPAKLDRKKLEIEVEEFKKKLEEKRKQLDAKGLKEAAKDLNAITKKVDKLVEDKNTDQKQALIKLNDIKKEIEDKRSALGDSEKFKEQLNKLKEFSKGPGKDLSKAIKDGDFKKAQQVAKELADKLAKGELKPEEVKKLAENLNELAEQIEKAVEEQKQKQEELKNQIEKAKQEGDLDKAAKLQEKLEQMQQNQKQQQQLQKMAQQLKKCANCMNPGNQPGQKPGEGGQQAAQAMQKAMQDAGQSLEDIAQQMEQMQQQMDQMDALQDMEDFAEEMKQAMQGQGGDGNKKNKGDWAKGRGRGDGKRGIQEDDTGNFKAQVQAKLNPGETVITGTADGQNITSRSTAETKKLVQAAMEKEVDPLENQTLSKKQREHAEQYFRALRENQ